MFCLAAMHGLPQIAGGRFLLRPVPRDATQRDRACPTHPQVLRALQRVRPAAPAHGPSRTFCVLKNRFTDSACNKTNPRSNCRAPLRLHCRPRTATPPLLIALSPRTAFLTRHMLSQAADGLLLLARTVAMAAYQRSADEQAESPFALRWLHC